MHRNLTYLLLALLLHATLFAIPAGAENCRAQTLNEVLTEVNKQVTHLRVANFNADLTLMESGYLSLYAYLKTCIAPGKPDADLVNNDLYLFACGVECHRQMANYQLFMAQDFKLLSQRDDKASSGSIATKLQYVTTGLQWIERGLAALPRQQSIAKTVSPTPANTNSDGANLDRYLEDLAKLRLTQLRLYMAGGDLWYQSVAQPRLQRLTFIVGQTLGPTKQDLATSNCQAEPDAERQAACEAQLTETANMQQARGYYERALWLLVEAKTDVPDSPSESFAATWGQLTALERDLRRRRDSLQRGLLYIGTDPDRYTRISFMELDKQLQALSQGLGTLEDKVAQYIKDWQAKKREADKAGKAEFQAQEDMAMRVSAHKIGNLQLQLEAAATTQQIQQQAIAQDRTTLEAEYATGMAAIEQQLQTAEQKRQDQQQQIDRARTDLEEREQQATSAAATALIKAERAAKEQQFKLAEAGLELQKQEDTATYNAARAELAFTMDAHTLHYKSRLREIQLELQTQLDKKRREQDLITARKEQDVLALDINAQEEKRRELRWRIDFAIATTNIEIQIEALDAQLTEYQRQIKDNETAMARLKLQSQQLDAETDKLGDDIKQAQAQIHDYQSQRDVLFKLQRASYQAQICGIQSALVFYGADVAPRPECGAIQSNPQGSFRQTQETMQQLRVQYTQDETRASAFAVKCVIGEQSAQGLIKPEFATALAAVDCSGAATQIALAKKIWDTEQAFGLQQLARIQGIEKTLRDDIQKVTNFVGKLQRTRASLEQAVDAAQIAYGIASELPMAVIGTLSGVVKDPSTSAKKLYELAKSKLNNGLRLIDDETREAFQSSTLNHNLRDAEKQLAALLDQKQRQKLAFERTVAQLNAQAQSQVAQGTTGVYAQKMAELQGQRDADQLAHSIEQLKTEQASLQSELDLATGHNERFAFFIAQQESRIRQIQAQMRQVASQKGELDLEIASKERDNTYIGGLRQSVQKRQTLATNLKTRVTGTANESITITDVLQQMRDQYKTGAIASVKQELDAMDRAMEQTQAKAILDQEKAAVALKQKQAEYDRALAVLADRDATEARKRQLQEQILGLSNRLTTAQHQAAATTKDAQEAAQTERLALERAKQAAETALAATNKQAHSQMALDQAAHQRAQLELTHQEQAINGEYLKLRQTTQAAMQTEQQHLLDSAKQVLEQARKQPSAADLMLASEADLALLLDGVPEFLARKNTLLEQANTMLHLLRTKAAVIDSMSSRDVTPIYPLDLSNDLPYVFTKNQLDRELEHLSRGVKMNDSQVTTNVVFLDIPTDSGFFQSLASGESIRFELRPGGSQNADSGYFNIWDAQLNGVENARLLKIWIGFSYAADAPRACENRRGYDLRHLGSGFVFTPSTEGLTALVPVFSGQPLRRLRDNAPNLNIPRDRDIFYERRDIIDQEQVTVADFIALGDGKIPKLPLLGLPLSATYELKLNQTPCPLTAATGFKIAVAYSDRAYSR